MTLLALLDLRPDASWSESANPMRGVSPIIDFANTWYRVRAGGYAENTRETFRKNAIHYFVAAQLILVNPDQPNRPTNSPRTVYQITPGALAVLRTFESNNWEERIAGYLNATGSLVDRYAGRRTIEQLPLKRLTDQTFTLSPGPHSNLILQIVSAFASRFTPNATLIYTGDTGKKLKSYFDEDTLAQLGVTITSAGTKIPDVVIHHSAKGWLDLVEAFTSVGPISPLRKEQLEHLFRASTAPLVFVTAFPDRRTMARQAPNLAWETDVWMADAPDHLIHFNGQRFLGPYES